MIVRAPLIRGLLSLMRDEWQVFGWRLPVLYTLMVASAFCEGLTLAMLLPLLSSLGVGGAASNVITDLVARILGIAGMSLTPASVGGLLLGLLALSATIFLVHAYVQSRLQMAYVAHSQRRLFDAVSAAGWPFLRRQRAGDVVAALTSEAARLASAFYQGNVIVSSVVFLIIQIAIAALIAPPVTVALLVLAVVLFAATQHMVRRALELGRATTNANADLIATGNELMGAMKLIKATAHEAEARKRLILQVDRLETLSFNYAFDLQIVRAIFEYSSGAAVALLLVGGPWLLGVDVAVVLIVVATFVRLFPKVTDLRQCVQSISLMLPAYDAMRALTVAAIAARETGPHAARHLPSGPAAIRLQCVAVDGELGEPILRDINLDIPAGSVLAVVGSTGAGKTTLVDCILGLIAPSEGDVLIDGVSISAIEFRAWRGSVGYLGQDPILFAGTLRDNVRWGRDQFDDAAVVTALDEAEAGFALRLPGGLDADLEDHVGSLSGGERQRIALARALLGEPRMLVLDEGTSALDAETERNIADAIRKRHGRTTVIVITHRITSARDADLIVMLDGGRIVEQGDCEALRAADGRFAAFWRMQQGSAPRVAESAAP